jgi:hypothetical protein
MPEMQTSIAGRVSGLIGEFRSPAAVENPKTAASRVGMRVKYGNRVPSEWLPTGCHESQRAFPNARRRLAGDAAAGSRNCGPWRLQAATPSTRSVRSLALHLTRLPGWGDRCVMDCGGDCFQVPAHRVTVTSSM